MACTNLFMACTNLIFSWHVLIFSWHVLIFWMLQSCWLCWGLTSQSTIFQSCRDGAIASWVINQYFRGIKCLAQGHNTAAVGLEPRTFRSGVGHSTTEPPRSPICCKVHAKDAEGVANRVGPDYYLPGIPLWYWEYMWANFVFISKLSSAI